MDSDWLTNFLSFITWKKRIILEVVPITVSLNQATVSQLDKKRRENNNNNNNLLKLEDENS